VTPLAHRTITVATTMCLAWGATRALDPEQAPAQSSPTAQHAALKDLPPPPKMPELVRWTDPTERAFTVNVPRGWRITGGTHRNAPIDARNWVAAESPDGTIRVWVDDPNTLPRQAPHPAYYRMGWYEGRVVQAPAGPLAIERFKTGAQFAQEFTAQKLCRNPRSLGLLDMRKATQEINSSIGAAAMRAGVQVQASAGDFTYRCGDKSGYTYTVTVQAWTTAQGPRTWAVYKLAGFLSDRAELDLARYVMNALVSSFTIDPAWQASYERQIQDTTEALMEISNRITQESIRRAQQSLQQNIAQVQRRQKEFDQINEMRQSSFQRQQESADRIRQRWSDITLGQVHGCDDLGRCSEQSNEYQYHWADKSGNVVGGPADGSPPGPDYRPWNPD